MFHDDIACNSLKKMTQTSFAAHQFCLVLVMLELFFLLHLSLGSKRGAPRGLPLVQRVLGERLHHLALLTSYILKVCLLRILNFLEGLQ